MGYCIEVSSWPGITIEIEKDNTWHVVRRPPVSFQGYSPFRSGQGTWSGGIGDMIQMHPPDDPNGLLMELRQATGRQGPAIMGR